MAAGVFDFELFSVAVLQTGFTPSTARNVEHRLIQHCLSQFAVPDALESTRRALLFGPFHTTVTAAGDAFVAGVKASTAFLFNMTAMPDPALISARGMPLAELMTETALLDAVQHMGLVELSDVQRWMHRQIMTALEPHRLLSLPQFTLV